MERDLFSAFILTTAITFAVLRWFVLLFKGTFHMVKMLVVTELLCMYAQKKKFNNSECFMVLLTGIDSQLIA